LIKHECKGTKDFAIKQGCVTAKEAQQTVFQEKKKKKRRNCNNVGRKRQALSDPNRFPQRGKRMLHKSERESVTFVTASVLHL
jgi:hypothetical protein